MGRAEQPSRAVIYHANCFDGFGAAWAAWSRYGTNASYYPASYGQELPDVGVVDELYFLDFSANLNTMRLLRYQVRDKLVILDHHQTAQEDLAKLARESWVEVHFDLERSGAPMAWDYFHPGVRMPKLLAYIEDRDLWRFALPESKAVNAGLRIYPFDFTEWDDLMMSMPELSLTELKRSGQVLLDFTDKTVKMMCDQAFELTIAGYRVPVVNATAFWSEVATELLERNPEAPFAAAFFDRSDDKTQWSLRSRPDFAVNRVAQAYGGGGHPQAAGFTTDRAARMELEDFDRQALRGR